MKGYLLILLEHAFLTLAAYLVIVVVAQFLSGFNASYFDSPFLSRLALLIMVLIIIKIILRLAKQNN